MRINNFPESIDNQWFRSNAVWLAGCFIAVLLLFSSCENWSEVEKLQAEVEAIHDAPMVKMEELENLQNRAGKLLAAADSTKKTELGNFITEAQAAHDAMFDWMAQYRAPDKEMMDKKAALDYLNKQKNAANNMSEKVFQSIENGKKLLTDK